MKTGFLYGGARIPKFVQYYYHGKIMQCRKEPWIPPYIYYDTHPAEYPPNYYYECDTVPEGATPHMIYWKTRCIIATIVGGLYDVKTKICPGYGASLAQYYWAIEPTAKVEITASFPTLEILNPGSGYISGAVYFDHHGYLGVGLSREYRTSHGHNYLYDEYTEIHKNRSTVFRRPFTNNIHIILEKILGTNKWNFYFNDEWIFDITNPNNAKIMFWISGPPSIYGHATMDYLRAWVDRERT